MMINKTNNNRQLLRLSVKAIDKKTAKTYTVKNHYMGSFPAKSTVSFGVFYRSRLCGVVVFGYSSSTLPKIQKYIPEIKLDETIEMLRMNLLDILGHNSESFVMSNCIRLIKKNAPQVKIILTHAGGCKNDCGILYQACSWLYFGSKKCNDFFLTPKGEYKNPSSQMRFGHVPERLKSDHQGAADYLWGKGCKRIEALRHTYMIPLRKGIRRKLIPHQKPYPKNSDRFRFNGKWQMKIL